ncbi:transmembrane protein, putative [Bodo saltans]|uniref:Transmembrane protein, putative n=1 Tax=Bodo saltans TaxID=75058 RepID=A0A0S4JT69_BODSA|nr:transmembrane protein, putative [Bodo saltans]|eukprot:CUG92596.1 transmembrane protein, putative [Bodo saltans]
MQVDFNHDEKSITGFEKYASPDDVVADAESPDSDDGKNSKSTTKPTSSSVYILENNNIHEGDTIQLVTGSVWAFLPPSHIPIAKALLTGFWGVAVFATLSAVGYPLGNSVPEACREESENFFYPFGFFGFLICILFPLWGLAFFGHMLDALQQGLLPFCRSYDRELTIGVGCGMVGALATSLYGLHVAPPTTIGSESECSKCHDVVRTSSWSFLLAVGGLSLLHVLHFQYMTRARQRYMDSRTVVLY